MWRLILTVSMVGLFAFSAFGTTEQKASVFVICKNQKDVRSIRVMPEEKENCSVSYSKGGVEQLVGTNRALSVCKSILQSIKSNLENSKYSCRSISTAKVTTSGEAVRRE